LLDAIKLLAAAARNFADRCVRGLTADRDRAFEYAERSLGNATSLVPEIGYDRAAAIAQEAFRSGRSIKDVATEKSGLPRERLAKLLDPLELATKSTGEHLLSQEELLDLMSEQSFPASDPPAY